MVAVKRTTVRISDVAEAAGVSNATVSRVMNNVTTVHPDLARRVREVAFDLGYQPNPLAQGLARGAVGAVGVLVPDLSNPYYHGVLKGIADEADAHGYSLMVSDSNENPEAELRFASELLRRVDGMVLCSPRMPYDDLARLLRGERPLVCTNRVLPRLPIPTVASHTYRGMLALCGHLFALGHRRVSYLAGPAYSASNAERVRALRDAAEFGLKADFFACGATTDDGYSGFDAALTCAPTAVINYNDVVALGALARSSERGIAVPRELSITGFDDIPYARYTTPSLTTVQTPTYEMGRHAWKLLVEQLEGRRGRELEDEVLDAELQVRESTGPAPEAS